jgi:uncharacterized protein YbjT (DUF2867 family)
MKYDCHFMNTTPPIFIAGATGYVGKRLLRAFEEKAIPVRCLVRRPETLQERAKATTEFIIGDALKAPSLRKALTHIHTAFYLANASDQAAKNFAHACVTQKVQKIVYLGEHHKRKVGEILLASGIPVVEFRASLILGAGSLSFEMMRALVERWPVVVLPRWVHTLAQPIGIEDVVSYLLEALVYRGPSRVIEIGGPEPVTYRELMREYARQRGLRRWMVSIPGLTPRLSKLWLRQAAPAYAHLSGRFIERLLTTSVVTHPQALNLFRVRPRSYPDAISWALRN